MRLVILLVLLLVLAGCRPFRHKAHPAPTTTIVADITEQVVATNGTATLTYPPLAGATKLYVNGLRLYESSDFTVAGKVVTLHAGLQKSPQAVLIVDYKANMARKK